MAKKIATVTTTGLLGFDIIEQQKSLLLIDLLKLGPTAVETSNNDYNLLWNNMPVTKFSANKPSVSFTTPLNLAIYVEPTTNTYYYE